MSITNTEALELTMEAKNRAEQREVNILERWLLRKIYKKIKRAASKGESSLLFQYTPVSSKVRQELVLKGFRVEDEFLWSEHIGTIIAWN